MARHSPPLPLDTLRAFFTLSHLSLSEMARRFGLSRSNLMGLLSGLSTVGSDKVDQLLAWSGLERRSGAELGLLPGLHLWQISSAREMEALFELPSTLLPDPSTATDFDLILDLPLIDESRVHLLIHLPEDRHILLSSRPDFFRLLQDRWPVLNRPQHLQCFRPPHTLPGLVTVSGRGSPLFLPSASVPSMFSPIGPVSSSVATHVADWATRARQHLHLDLEHCLSVDDQVIPSNSASCTSFLDMDAASEKPVSRFDAGNTPTPVDATCTQTRQLLTRRLDVGGGAHRKICDIPLFLLEGKHDYPSGMIRMDRAFLGPERLALGKAQRLRFYQQSPESTEGVRWLVVMAAGSPPCGHPGSSRDGMSPRGCRYLVRREGHLHITDTPDEGDSWIGMVVGRFEAFPLLT
ncbi:hypothetical protein [Acidithiobacillus ferrivorans]|uniref:hypothetical protein n=1 Tax=Acidithiobacillus ferrivorans TaxID=160808 RepID=UPI001E42A082|nr:hypothetical protein [Acidithiobacillus ferrivorans]